VTTGCAEWRGDLAGYLLGMLDQPDRRRVEGHLAGCPDCRAELATLAPVPGWLARLSPEEAARGPLAPDPALAGRLVAAAGADRRRARHRRRALAAAAAAVVAAGTAGGVAAAVLPTATSPTVFRAADAATGVRGTVRLTAEPTGTAIDLTVSGVPSDDHCRLIAVSTAGARDVAGSWLAGYHGAAHVDGSTAIPRSRLAALLVEGPGGRTLLAVRL
jgi:predicted anti-sigma-YlaC factor YlaD